MDSYFDNLFNDIDSNIKLDEEQRKAVMCDGNSIIIAGAGSGKTTTMAAKVKYLVDNGVDACDIIVISYTNKAVSELKERINDGFKISCLICTFHKFALNILKLKGLSYGILSDATNIIYDYVFNNYKNVCKKEEVSKVTDYCCDFLKRFKNMGYGISNIDKWIEFLKGKDLRFVLFFKDLYVYYNSYLIKNNLIDFEDIINKANEVLDDIKLSYKYIIVDEFQDISLQRFNLIYKINKLFKSNIVVVGDDFQSIFEFAGSNVNLFTSFADKLDNVKVLKIVHTYRNSQDLIDIAGKFVMKNSLQIKKNLISNKRINNPISIYYGRKKILVLNRIIENIYKEFNNKKVLLLGRYNFDIDSFIDNKYFKLVNNKVIWKNSDLDITFLTVHSAKGLGYDNVVILNGFSGEYGFPSMVMEDKVMSLVSVQNDDFYLSEERRLFYVALTRTKNKVYIISSFFNSSIFVKEIKYYVGVKKRMSLNSFLDIM